MGIARVENKPYHSLIVDGSRVWLCSEDSQPQGWDFRIPGSTPILLPNTSLDITYLDSLNNTRLFDQSGTEDIVNGKLAFQLSGRYSWPIMVQWDNQHLVTGYGSGEVLILGFNHAIH